MSNATLDQTEQLRRMIAYADSREYVIDFHNFDIRSPDILQFRTTGKVNLNCMGFNYLHDIQNLRIYNNKTTQLKPGKCLLGFYPKSNMSGTFKLTNVKFDPYVENYSLIDPNTGTSVGEGDGSMHGFSTFPHPEWKDYYNFAESFTNISFDLNDVEFISNAVSYNIELARIPAKKVTLKNIKGEYLALMVHHYAKDLIAEDVHGIYRDDLHASGRSLVTNLLHSEPAMVTNKNIKIGVHSLRNMSSVKSNGETYNVYKYHAMGLSTEIEKLSADNVKGFVGTNTTVPETYPLVIREFELLNSRDTRFAGAFSADKIRLKDSILASNIMPSKKVWKDFEAVNCTLNLLFFDSTSTDLAEHGDFKFISCVFMEARGIGYSRDSNRWFNSIKIIDCEFSNGIIETGFKTLEVVGGSVANQVDNVGDVIAPSKVADTDTRASSIYINGLRCNKPQASSTFFVKGTFSPNRTINVQATNMVLATRFRTSGSNVVVKEINTSRVNSIASQTYDPPSLVAGATITTTVVVSNVIVGDLVQAAFTQYSADIEISAVVSAVDTVTVKFKNTGTTVIDLPSGTIKIRTIT